jgi:hypothetical protein
MRCARRFPSWSTGDQVAVTADGHALLTAVRGKVAEFVRPAYGAITPEDSATAARVLTTITAKLNEELQQRSVLVLGASQRVVDECLAALRDLGYTAPPAAWFAPVQVDAAIYNFGIAAGQ